MMRIRGAYAQTKRQADSPNAQEELSGPAQVKNGDTIAFEGSESVDLRVERAPREPAHATARSFGLGRRKMRKSRASPTSRSRALIRSQGGRERRRGGG